MTEADWLSSTDPLAMYRFLQESTTLMRTRWQGWVPVRRFRFGPRRQALFRLAVAHLLMPYTRSDTVRCLIAELRAGLFDGTTSPEEAALQAAFWDEVRAAHPPETRSAWEALHALLATDPALHADGLFLAGTAAAEAAFSHDDLWQRASRVKSDREVHAHLLREFAGNPFHSPQLPDDWATWDAGLIPAMAGRIDREEDFFALPVLADALEDAGCVDAILLEHCRQETLHRRGCWVLELLLGRE